MIDSFVGGSFFKSHGHKDSKHSSPKKRKSSAMSIDKNKIKEETVPMNTVNEEDAVTKSIATDKDIESGPEKR